jgi:hypothetical protein
MGTTRYTEIPNEYQTNTRYLNMSTIFGVHSVAEIILVHECGVNRTVIDCQSQPPSKSNNRFEGPRG